MWGCSLGISRDLGSRLKLLGIGGKKGFLWTFLGFRDWELGFVVYGQGLAYLMKMTGLKME